MPRDFTKLQQFQESLAGHPTLGPQAQGILSLLGQSTQPQSSSSQEAQTVQGSDTITAQKKVSDEGQLLSQGSFSEVDNKPATPDQDTKQQDVPKDHQLAPTIHKTIPKTASLYDVLAARISKK